MNSITKHFTMAIVWTVAGAASFLYSGNKAYANPSVYVVLEKSYVNKGESSFFDVYIDSNGENTIWGIDADLTYNNNNLSIDSAECFYDRFWDNKPVTILGLDGLTANGINFNNLGDARDANDAAFKVNFTANVLGTTEIDFHDSFSGAYTILVGTNPITKYTTDPTEPDDVLLNTIGASIQVVRLGDVNNDNFVGGGDLNTILGNWGLSGATRAQGDLTGEGEVGGADYNEVLSHWGEGVPPEPGQSIPEPATLGMLTLGGLAFLRRRPRQK